MQINQVNQTNNRSAVNFNGAAKFLASQDNMDALSRFARINGLEDISLALEKKFINVMFNNNEAKTLMELEKQGIKEYIYLNKPNLATTEFDTFVQTKAPEVKEKVEIKNINELVTLLKKSIKKKF